MRVAVTGGGGFLGREIVERCLGRGESVVSLARGSYPDLERLGARCHQVDLVDADAVRRALEGCELVYHVAARAGVWGPREAFFAPNVIGTRSVLAACRELGIPRLVFTSSPSVCFDGRDHVRAGRDLPYPERYLAHYPKTKAIAEREVLAANSPELATCALRPHLIFGERDPHIVPRLIERARAGRLKIVGRGDNEVSLTYVGNAAHAHLCAADALRPGAPHAGRAYFLSQAEPVRLWSWIDEILEGVGLEPVRARVPHGLARGIGGLCELLWKALPLSGEPPMTRFVADQFATSHSYDLEPARADFGYVEEVDLAEATRRTIEAFR